ncbi:MAG: hypothetical protein CME60_00620 [Halobacteriovoraceae bacterium]|nr:hypothetical protein [Halobacteriovoraceae bacterium]|tara:strand:- start:758 stop:1537 length:780 start_codon:yes stop_codon:yes gene_type:complete
MFYLSLFLKGITHRPWSGIVWAATSLTVLALCLMGPRVENLFENKVVIQSETNPYFYAIMPNKINSNYVKRKLLELPGVEKVFVLSEENVSSQIKSILSQASIEWDSDLMDLNYGGIKVSLSPDLKLRSQELIRSYLTRLTGKNEVTMGAIKVPEVKEVESKSLYFENKLLFLAILTGIAYFISLGMIYRSLKEESFIYEQYQRKKQIYLKTLSYSQAPLLAGVILSTLYYKMIMLPLLAAVVFSMAFYLIIGDRKKVC